METVTLHLTENECLYLSDRLSYATPGPDGASLHPRLLLKIGAALLEAHREAAAPIAFSAREIWAIRETVKSRDMIGQKTVGLDLLPRLYQALLTLEDAVEIGDVVVVGEDERSYAERRAAARQGGHDARDEQDERNKRDDPHDDANPYANG